jgi:hypothetical protein
VNTASRIALGKFNVARHDLDYMRFTTIGAGLDRRSQITPTNFDLQHGPSTQPPWRHWNRATASGLPPRTLCRRKPFPRQSHSPIFCPRAIEAARRRVSMWKIMAEITCRRKNPCRVAFGQQRGVTPGLSFRAPGGSPRNGAITDPAMICSDYAWKESESGNIRGGLSLGPGDPDNARRLATQLIQLQPAANDAATICFSASGTTGYALHPAQACHYVALQWKARRMALWSNAHLP